MIVDELREMDDWNFIAAAKPTLTVSPGPADALPVQRRHRSSPSS